jgi:hypothetical protein
MGPRLRAGIGGEPDAIGREVMRRVGQGIHPELVKPAVQDAIDHAEAALVIERADASSPGAPSVYLTEARKATVRRFGRSHEWHKLKRNVLLQNDLRLQFGRRSGDNLDMFDSTFGQK